MADNYLEKRYDEVFGPGRSRSSSVSLNHPSLEKLLFRNRPCFRYDKNYVVHPLQLRSIIAVNSRLGGLLSDVPDACGAGLQLRFRPVVKGAESEAVADVIESNAFAADTAPEAFIIVCSRTPEKALSASLGIALQTMLLKAVDLGLSGLIIPDFDHDSLKSSLALDLEPLAIIAIGKSLETPPEIPETPIEELIIK